MTIYLDLAVEEGLRRKAQANSSGQGEWNRMDQLQLEFHHRVRAGYLEMAQVERERWLVVDATGSVEATHGLICQRLDEVLARMSSGSGGFSG